MKITVNIADLPGHDLEQEIITRCVTEVQKVKPTLSEAFIRGYVVGFLKKNPPSMTIDIVYQDNPFKDTGINPEFFHGHMLGSK